MQEHIRQHSELSSASAHSRGTEVARVARRWIGTPFHHQGRVKGVGVDCAGLAVGIAREMGIEVEDQKGYPRLPNSDDMERILDQQCQVTKEEQIGNILFIRYDATLHLAIITRMNPTYIIHAHQPSGKVIEHRLDNVWRRRIRKMYLWPS